MNNSKSHTISEISGAFVDESDVSRKSIQFWSEEERKYMMQLYEENVKKVGPAKRFKMKKHMWMHIASIMVEKFGRDFTHVQVENRFKNEKRKKRDRHTNVPSSHKVFSYDHELEQAMDMEHSLSPEVEIMRSTTSVKKIEPGSADDYYNSNEIPCAPSPPFLFGESNDNIILKYMQQQQEIFKEKEERKQKRHDEKMIVLKGIGESLQRLLERKKKYAS